MDKHRYSRSALLKLQDSPLTQAPSAALPEVLATRQPEGPPTDESVTFKRRQRPANVPRDKAAPVEQGFTAIPLSEWFKEEPLAEKQDESFFFGPRADAAAETAEKPVDELSTWLKEKLALKLSTSTSRWASPDACVQEPPSPSVPSGVDRERAESAAASKTVPSKAQPVAKEAVQHHEARPELEQQEANAVRKVDLSSLSSSTSRWASAPPTKPAAPTAVGKSEPPDTNDSSERRTSLSIKGAAAAQSSDMERRDSTDSTTTWTSSSSGDVSTQPTSAASSRAASPAQSRRVPKAPSTMLSGSTARPRRARSAVQSTASFSSVQTASLLKVMDDSMNDDKPFLSFAAAQWDGDLDDLNFEQLRRASGGPPLPRIPREVIDVKIKEIRAKNRLWLKEKRASQGLGTVFEEKDEVVNINYDEERIKWQAIKLAYIEALRKIDNSQQDNDPGHPDAHERPPSLRRSRSRSPIRSQDTLQGRAQRDYENRAEETGWGSEVSKETKNVDDWNVQSSPITSDAGKSATCLPEGIERGWGDTTEDQKASEEAGWDELAKLGREELLDLPRTSKQASTGSTSTKLDKLEVGWSSAPLMPQEDEEEW